MRSVAVSAIHSVRRAGGLVALLMVAPWWAPVVLAQPAPFAQWSPSGSITSTTPNFTWQESAGATQYWFEIDNATTHVFQSYYSTSVCSGGMCSVTPAIALPADSYNWWVQAQNSSGKTWGQGLYFTVLPPPAPVLQSPSGSTRNYTLTYVWQASAGATQYWLEVDTSSAHAFQSYFQPSVCSGGTCSVTPAIALPADSYNWWVQAQSPAGKTWGNPMNFNVLPPSAPTLVSPSGSSTNYTPTFTWRASPEATQYWFEIDNSTTHVFQSYFQPAVCSGGTCSVTPAITLPADSYNWWVQAQNPAGKTWGTAMNFTVLPPSAPILLSPSGPVDVFTPTFTWQASPEAAQYWFEIDQGSTAIFRSYFQPTVCFSGTCSVTPSIVLAPGSYVWGVQAQNPAGKTWGNLMHFTVLWHPVKVHRDSEGAHFFDVWDGHKYQPTILVGFSNLWIGRADAEIQRRLQLLKDSNANFIRLWLRPSDVKLAYAYDPSQGKVNLDQFNDQFFKRVDSILTMAEQSAIVVEVMIWDSSTGWLSNGNPSPGPPPPLNPPPANWTDPCTTQVGNKACANVHHPLNSYSASGDVVQNYTLTTSKICNDSVPEWYSTENATWMQYQQRYMTRLMTELQKHNNVTVEIMNEACGPGNSTWRQSVLGWFRGNYPELLLQSEGLADEDQVRQLGPAFVDMMSTHLGRNPALPSGWTYDVAQRAYYGLSTTPASPPGVLPGSNEYDGPNSDLIPCDTCYPSELARMMWGLTMGGGAFYIENVDEGRGPNPPDIPKPELGPQYVPALFNFFHPLDTPPEFWRMAPNKGLVTSPNDNPTNKYVLATSDASEILIYRDDQGSPDCFSVGITGSYRYRWFNAASSVWTGWTDWQGGCFMAPGPNYGLHLLKR